MILRVTLIGRCACGCVSRVYKFIHLTRFMCDYQDFLLVIFFKFLLVFRNFCIARELFYNLKKFIY